MVWAAEHILVEGNENLILCERGVVSPHTHKITSRFMLDIQAIVAANELTTFPIISDPSHASFWAPWVEKLALASVAGGCDGLIIEVHPNPAKSKVDPLQPLNYRQFKQLNKKLKLISKKFIQKNCLMLRCYIIGYPLKILDRLFCGKIFKKKKINSSMKPLELTKNKLRILIKQFKKDKNF